MNENYIYLLVTPAKNEESSLDEVANSVVKQTIRPMLWVIVDDGSIDKTPAILKNLECNYDWVKILTLPQHERDITFHYSYVCKKGFDFILEYSKSNNICYEYVCLLDADTILMKNYFELIIDEFEKDLTLGIASGGVYYYHNSQLKWERTNENLPRGTGRMWRKNCFFDTNGYSIEPAPDSISNVKALNRGWKIRQFKDVMAVQTRRTSSGEGLLKGYKKNGYMAYYLNKHPILVLLIFLNYSIKPPFYLGIPFICGYLCSLLRQEDRIIDPEIRDYFRNKRLKEVLESRLKSLSRNSKAKKY